ncbi:MAG: conserved hypothetical cytosolic protein [Ferruginibacter sp.]|nr:conserved hypothetical cytosolic protein [Ferruginibacter sp.]
MYDLAFLQLAHKGSSSNKEELKDWQCCGCFYCMQRFETKEVVEYFEESLKEGETAVCPKCGIDSVLSDRFPVADKEFLEAMNAYFF